MRIRVAQDFILDCSEVSISQIIPTGLGLTMTLLHIEIGEAVEFKFGI